MSGSHSVELHAFGHVSAVGVILSPVVIAMVYIVNTDTDLVRHDSTAFVRFICGGCYCPCLLTCIPWTYGPGCFMFLFLCCLSF